MTAFATDDLCRLTIDLDAIAGNWRQLAARAAPAECAAAVKADAYGCGIDAVAPALHRAGCRTFFVAHVAEGSRCRAALRTRQLEARVFVLNGYHPSAAALHDYVEYDLSAVIGSGPELAAWIADRQRTPGAGALAAALHVDTGMNRLGIPPDEARQIAAVTFEAAGISLVMSHFVSSEMADAPVNAAQVAAFDAVREGVLGRWPASLANSSGLFLPARPAYDLVRPGYALYGGNPTPGANNPMRPVVSLHARILQVRDVPAGATAGYNARWTAPRPSRLATLPIGYADGLPMGASGIDRGGAPVFIGEHPCPVVGRISMDLTIVDVTEVPDAEFAAATHVEVLGPHVGVDDLARCAGTIGYRVLTGLGPRHRRHYLGG